MKMDVKFTLKYGIENNETFLQLISDIPEDFDFEMLDKFLKIYRPMSIPTKGQYKSALEIIGDYFLHTMDKALNNEKNYN